MCGGWEPHGDRDGCDWDEGAGESWASFFRAAEGALGLVGEQEVNEEAESWCGEEARGDEDDGI